MRHIEVQRPATGDSATRLTKRTGVEMNRLAASVQIASKERPKRRARDNEPPTLGFRDKSSRALPLPVAQQRERPALRIRGDIDGYGPEVNLSVAGHGGRMLVRDRLKHHLSPRLGPALFEQRDDPSD